MSDDFSRLIRPHPDGAELAVKVVPGAARTRIAGVLGDALKVTLAAPAEAGKANRALLAHLADALALRPADLELLAGHSHPRKRVLVRALRAEDLAARLAALLAPPA